MNVVSVTRFANVVEELTWRGALKDVTPGGERRLIEDKVTLYMGIDPTSDSLHIGHLSSIMGLARMQQHGHRPVVLLGGGTSMIGDPSGKSKERPILAKETVKQNAEAIKSQLGRFFRFGKGEDSDVYSSALMVDNAEWLAEVRLVDFLRDVGKLQSINEMLKLDCVKRRRERGISYAEFSYQLLQAYDYLVLYDRYGCTFQTGGSDQWGNILAGTSLIRKARGAETHALVHPLIVDSRGDKFGKTASGDAPCLNRERTSPYQLYQFFFNTADADVIRYLKLFTTLSPEEIGQASDELNSNPKGRFAQIKLAEEVTRTVHGDEGLAQASEDSQGARLYIGGAERKQKLPSTTPVTQESARQSTGRIGAVVPVLADLLMSKKRLLDLLVLAFDSVAEVKRLVRQGGLMVNGEAVTPDILFKTPMRENFKVERGSSVSSVHIRRGKKTLITLEPCEDMDQKDAHGSSALHREVRARRYKKVASLLKRGANPLVQDGEGNSSLDYAKANKDVEMITLLQRAVPDGR